MQALAAGGSYAAALEVYRELRLRLHREISAEPDPETQAVFQQLRLEARAGGRRQGHRAAVGSQVVAPDLPAEFPPLNTLDVRPQNLPAQATPLIGREKETAAVQALLRREEVRLVTLTGPGGTGKTRLGLQVAADLLDEFADGVFFVELAPISDPDLVASTIAQTLGVRETSGMPAAGEPEGIPRRTGTSCCCWTTSSRCWTPRRWWPSCWRRRPRLKVLVTSRAVLRSAGEHEYPGPAAGAARPAAAAAAGGADRSTPRWSCSSQRARGGRARLRG